MKSPFWTQKMRQGSIDLFNGYKNSHRRSTRWRAAIVKSDVNKQALLSKHWRVFENSLCIKKGIAREIDSLLWNIQTVFIVKNETYSRRLSNGRNYAKSIQLNSTHPNKPKYRCCFHIWLIAIRQITSSEACIITRALFPATKTLTWAATRVSNMHGYTRNMGS